MTKRTERYDLAIGSTDESNVKKTLQEACDINDTYPVSIRKSNNGFVVSFLRPFSKPGYLYQNIMASIANKLKHDLTISTVIIQRKMGMIDENNIPLTITKISKSKEVKISSKEDNVLLQKYEEDSDYFNSFLGKQILEGDYDTSEGRKADKHTLKMMRANKRMNNLISESKEESKKVIKGQYTLNLEKLS